jgi:hypothetical protein
LEVLNSVFIAYTDASIGNKKAYLAFVAVFEDKSIIRRRIVVNESDSNIAEALAIKELLSFLVFYNFRGGLILLDSNGVKSQLKKKGRKIHKYLPKDTKEILRNLQIRTQVIPRKYNVAHGICYEDKFLKSNSVSSINRLFLQKQPEYPHYLMQLSVLEEYKQLFNKLRMTFHEAQMKLNKKIWLADLVEEVADFKVYVIHNMKIKVYRDTIVKLNKGDYEGDEGSARREYGNKKM